MKRKDTPKVEGEEASDRASELRKQQDERARASTSEGPKKSLKVLEHTIGKASEKNYSGLLVKGLEGWKDQLRLWLEDCPERSWKERSRQNIEVKLT